VEALVVVSWVEATGPQLVEVGVLVSLLVQGVVMALLVEQLVVLVA
jgi:hypothetical protein